MKLYIRDDDTGYFTQAHELEQAYEGVWDKGCISLAVIPFDIPTTGQGHWDLLVQDPSKEYPLGDNQELVNFICKKIKDNKAYIMLHGYNHYYKVSKHSGVKTFTPEFVHRKNPLYYLEKGKDYLESLFNQEIKWFIPPSNAISVEALSACDQLGLNMPLVMGYRHRRFFSPWVVKNYLLSKLGLKTRRNPLLRFDRHKEIACHSFTKYSDWLDIENHYPKDRFVIATHYWEVNEFGFIKREIDKYVRVFGSVHSIAELK